LLGFLELRITVVYTR